MSSPPEPAYTASGRLGHPTGLVDAAPPRPPARRPAALVRPDPQRRLRPRARPPARRIDPPVRLRAHARQVRRVDSTHWSRMVTSVTFSRSATAMTEASGAAQREAAAGHPDGVRFD